MDQDGEVDVFHAVKQIRINRPQLIDTKVHSYSTSASSSIVSNRVSSFQDEYKYLYDLVLHWYVMNPDYRSGLAATGNAVVENHAPAYDEYPENSI